LGAGGRGAGGGGWWKGGCRVGVGGGGGWGGEVGFVAGWGAWVVGCFVLWGELVQGRAWGAFVGRVGGGVQGGGWGQWLIFLLLRWGGMGGGGRSLEGGACGVGLGGACRRLKV